MNNYLVILLVCIIRTITLFCYFILQRWLVQMQYFLEAVSKNGIRIICMYYLQEKTQMYLISKGGWI